MYRRSSFIRAAVKQQARKTKLFTPSSVIRTFMVWQYVPKSAVRYQAAEPMSLLSGEETPHQQVRLEFELFHKKTPMAAENFAKLCSGEAALSETSTIESIMDPGFADQFEPQLEYLDSAIHRIIPQYMVQGGDVTHQDGLGQISIFGPSFEAPGELNVVKFDRRGLLGTAVSAPHLNGSQFFILLREKGAEHLNGTCICFGRISKGIDDLEAMINNVEVNYQGQPVPAIRIVDCGIL